MKKIIKLFIFIFLLLTPLCNNKNNNSSNNDSFNNDDLINDNNIKKDLIIYFSYSKNTFKVTKEINPSISHTFNNVNEIVKKKISRWELDKKEIDNGINFSFLNNKINAKLGDNKPSTDLINRLKNNMISLLFSDFNNSEKITYFDKKLDVENESVCNPNIGDIVIYKPCCNLSIFYKDSASYSSSLIYVGSITKEDINKIKQIEDNTKVNIQLEE